MKAILAIACFCVLAMASQAQETDSINTKSSKLYLGVSFSTVSHNLYYKSPKVGTNTTIGHFAPLSLNLGYKLSERTSIQAGVAYGDSSDHVDWRNNDGTISYDSYAKTHVIAFSLTARHSF